MKYVKSIVFLFLVSLILSFRSFSSELTFKFLNPSFGGDPLYGSFLLQEAQLQNTFKEKSASFYKPKSLLERFSESFTSQLIYRMADIMLDQIFGEDNQLPDQPATYTIGNFRITFDPTGDNYVFEIYDLSTGESTRLEMPKYL
mgnify:CR=1 FL=1